MYEQAYARNPTEDIGVLWFFSTLRLADCSKALFTIALKLHHSNRGDSVRYLLWALTALHLRPSERPSEADLKHLRLAEALLEKRSLSSTHVSSIEEILLWVLTAEQTGSYEKALAALDSSPTSVFPSGQAGERNLLRADLLAKAGRWQDALDVIEPVMMEKGVFDWAAWKIYLEALQKTSSSLEEGCAHVLAVTGSSTDERSRLLAAIDVAITVVSEDEASSNERIAAAVQAYLERFGEKSCCPADLHHLSQSMSVGAREHLRDLFRGKIESDGLLYAKLYRIFGGKDSDGSVFKAVRSNIPGSLHHLAIIQIDAGEWIPALKSLQEAMRLQPEDFVLRLTSLLVWLRLGAVWEALEIFRTLDIKQIQLDTLAYLLSDHLLDLGDLTHAEAFFHEAFFIYDDNRSNSWSLLADAFGRGAYAQVPELYRFAQRLEHSIQAVACILGTIRIELLRPKQTLEQLGAYLTGLRADELLFEDKFIPELCDNRDRSVVDFCDVAGTVRERLLDSLHSFDHASIWTWTLLPLVLRSLLTMNSSSSLQEESLTLASLKLRLTEKALTMPTVQSSVHLEKVLWLETLIDAFLSPNERLSSWLDEQVDWFHSHQSLHQDYEGMVQRGWIVERFRWTCLALGFYLIGHSPKLRKAILKDSSHLGASQIRRFGAIAGQLCETVFKKLAVVPEASEAIERSLTEQWNRSFGQWAEVLVSSVRCLEQAADLSTPSLLQK